MAPRFTVAASRAKRTETDEERLARFATLRDSNDPCDAEEAMRLAEKLVEHYAGLVGAAVRRWRNRMPSGLRVLGFDDLHAAGLRGLWEALLNCDPSGEQPFASFASTRVSWAISLEVRRADFLKEHARREVLRSWRAVSSLENCLGREATEEEAAKASGVSVDRYRDLCLWDRRSLTSELTDPVEKYLSRTEGDPLERLCAVEEALESLKGRDQEMREAALEIGVAVEKVKGYFEIAEADETERAA
ncbi:sigma-70 family RNA polymerase sigma factor [Rubrobacter aplysinae]|uniref:sigma-70 family RNA polymerase sigma factor n=1 Tax=Rubrobacter aplysinae TaxID=909625 RepID=UPI00064BB788|nr:hypothetical protein [Rubrobacter aplysinae]